MILALILILRSVPSDEQLLINEFYRFLPPEISKENKKAVADYIVDYFGEAEEFKFNFHRSYTLSKRPCSQPSVFAEATVLEFK
jgi:hypothetical protein